MSANEQDDLRQILDKHAEYYIKETMKFFQNEGVSPALSKDNPGDLEALGALQAYIAQHTKEAERRARIDEVKRFGTEWGNNPNTPHWYAWDDYIEDRLTELSAPQQSKERSA